MRSESYRYLQILAVAICVDFSDYLAWTLPQNIRHFDSFTIVTTKGDSQTQLIASRFGAAIVLTERLRDKGSRFDRGAAINDGLEQLQVKKTGSGTEKTL